MRSLTLSALILALCAAWAWWWPVGLVILWGSLAVLLLALSGLVFVVDLVHPGPVQ